MSFPSKRIFLEIQRRGIFAIGFRRFLDWLDWMLPQAWVSRQSRPEHLTISQDVEHNKAISDAFPLLRCVSRPTTTTCPKRRILISSSITLSSFDPCHCQRWELEQLATSESSLVWKAMKYMSMLLWIFTWKLTYYSPNTFKDINEHGVCVCVLVGVGFCQEGWLALSKLAELVQEDRSRQP